MNVIRPWLWIGGYRDSCDRAGLAARGIATLLQLAANVRHPGLTTIYLPIDDGVPVAPAVFDQSIAALRAAHAAGTPLMVACGAGISRSATIAIAGIAAIEGCGLRDAWRIVKAVHPPAWPHPALWESLCAYTGEAVPVIALLQD